MPSCKIDYVSQRLCLDWAFLAADPQRPAPFPFPAAKQERLQKGVVLIMAMKQIEIGTCVPGPMAKEWLPHLAKAGFECVSLNFHMSLEGADLKKMAEELMPIVKEAGIRVASLGYYCNAIQFEDHKKTLEYCIDSAKYFEAPIVSTFAGAYEGESVEKAMPKFG